MSVAASSWISSAVIHTHVMSACWPENQIRPKAPRICNAGNVAFLPAPVAGYRIRHAAAGVLVEVKPSHAPAIELARCADAEAARTILAEIAAGHARPYLGEIGRVA